MSIYAELKKGHKIAISKEINTIVREHVFSKGWKVEPQDWEDLMRGIRYFYFAHIKVESLETEEEKESFLEELRIKIAYSFNEFQNREATPKQVYYYVALCLEAGEIPRQILRNKEIFDEIIRLREELGK